MKISVIKYRGLWWALSGVLVLIGIIGMIISWQTLGAPLRPSLDFVGGTRLQLERDCQQTQNCAQPIELTTVREVVDAQGLPNSSIQIVGQNQQAVSIRTKALNGDQRTKLQTALSEKLGAFNPKKTQIDTVGPTLGQELFSKGLWALIVSFIGIVIYLSVRFQADYAVIAIVALFHDVLITAGFFSILGLVAGVEADSLFVVAILTITGFSVTDTVVIYDRIREILHEHPNDPIDKVVDDAVNQTLTRSLNTTLTVLLTLLSLFIFGGETLKNFALALIIGFTMGAYSSIFLASPLLALWRQRSSKSKPVESAESNVSSS
ncbi:protein translocase subunit SecF [Aetokthonos hydrillicola Thurmond2011]|jgi:preprotein translocase subunit SecF|uniref:Protein-export membrane protein SecF n=1 Tax=Aetokthonos hydrillicola Thurmond2011 TaxID=2712845 RepID=A0AAP5IBI5_9CYAN|nr:protein translocase subunit SecF [Aetokthonos hydrillicola]MBO3458108.1 protein translocase subunit SecF [Aetokthonos hydrillicola CCALA 1050]MBW4584329.1 protein translocase subunit SecF [Aetokthonos hydrillicola CCALA 1050]MDR9898463.1 protein translocase subunit SecF [Aetokthonos hydrillicola Thurmond2011]